MRAGVVDVGTNSVRLLVAEPPGVREIERDLVITRLGEGVDASRALGDEPLRRTVDAIARAVGRARSLGASSIRVIATSAVRDATNRGAFVDAVRAATGIEPAVLSGDEEARLGFAGATIAIDEPGPFLVCDIGGGSTELVRGIDGVEAAISLDIGSVRLTERHVRADPPGTSELEAVRADARETLRQADGVARGARTLVGLAGTITTVAALDRGLAVYDRAAIHHHVLSRDAIAAIAARLASMTVAERRDLPVMPPGREDVIVAGVMILLEAMERFGHERCVVSETDILDGAAMEILAHAEPGVSR